MCSGHATASAQNIKCPSPATSENSIRDALPVSSPATSENSIRYALPVSSPATSEDSIAYALPVDDEDEDVVQANRDVDAGADEELQRSLDWLCEGACSLDFLAQEETQDVSAPQVVVPPDAMDVLSPDSAKWSRFSPVPHTGVEHKSCSYMLKINKCGTHITKKGKQRKARSQQDPFINVVDKHPIFRRRRMYATHGEGATGDASELAAAMCESPWLIQGGAACATLASCDAQDANIAVVPCCPTLASCDAQDTNFAVVSSCPILVSGNAQYTPQTHILEPMYDHDHIISLKDCTASGISRSTFFQMGAILKTEGGVTGFYVDRGPVFYHARPIDWQDFTTITQFPEYNRLRYVYGRRDLPAYKDHELNQVHDLEYSCTLCSSTDVCGAQRQCLSWSQGRVINRDIQARLDEYSKSDVNDVPLFGPLRPLPDIGEFVCNRCFTRVLRNQPFFSQSIRLSRPHKAVTYRPLRHGAGNKAVLTCPWVMTEAEMGVGSYIWDKVAQGNSIRDAAREEKEEAEEQVVDKEVGRKCQRKYSFHAKAELWTTKVIGEHFHNAEQAQREVWKFRAAFVRENVHRARSHL